MAETKVENFTFWNFVKDNPLMYYPLLVIIGIAMVNIIFDLGPLEEVGTRMIWWIAIGVQWIGFERNRQKRKIEQIKLDQDLLKTYAELSQMTGEPSVRFLVPFHEKFISRMWNKLRNRTALSLYAPQKIGRLASFTKLHATQKEMFELKLKGCINTDDGALALKGLQCLSQGKKLKLAL